MAVSAKIKNLAPGAYFNAGPVEVVVLEHFTDGRTLLAAKEPIGNRPFTVRPFTYNRMEPEPAANNFAFSTLCHDLNNASYVRIVLSDGGLSNDYAYYGYRGVRPAFFVESEICLSLDQEEIELSDEALLTGFTSKQLVNEVLRRIAAGEDNEDE